ncbi:MAG TPA: hypothetical protein VK541_08510 [Pedobacter sp.]|uniref:hypothetical protein n=1 Tax=Pedobacter sp. TaxID=1411316 RepID=UPI002D19A183|nr:hypothetical protein [Pedobacter sp.]HMI02508.1 hypothetical protein [Pedobacter sp.]
MKTKLSAVFLALLFIGIFFACRKDSSSPNSAVVKEQLADPNYPMNVAQGKMYYKSLIKKEGKIVLKSAISTSSETRKNKKFAIFSKAITTESSKFTYLEMPLVYNKRPSVILSFNNVKESKDVIQKILRGSFDRLVIYKDKATGKVNQRIITFVPDVSCLGKFSKDVKSNRTGKLDRNFSGWLVYSKWDGTKLFAIKINNGRAKHSIKYKGKKNIKELASTSTENCVTYETIEYEIDCFTVTAEGGEEVEICNWSETGAVWYETICEPVEDEEWEEPGDPECYEDNTCSEGGDYDDAEAVFDTDCESFSFKKTTAANWQEAGLNKISLKMAWIGSGGSVLAYRNIQVNHLVYGLPTFYTNANGTTTPLSGGEAANIAAAATEWARNMTYTEFRASPTYPSDAAMQTYFKAQVNTYMSSHMGTAGVTGSGSSAIVFNDEERSHYTDPNDC